MIRSIAAGLNGIILGEKARQRDAGSGLRAKPQRGERLLRQQAAAGGEAEQPQIGRGAGERRVGLPCRGGRAAMCVARARLSTASPSRAPVQPKAGSLLAFTASTLPRNSSR